MDEDIDICIYIYKKKTLKINIMDRYMEYIYLKKRHPKTQSPIAH